MVIDEHYPKQGERKSKHNCLLWKLQTLGPKFIKIRKMRVSHQTRSTQSEENNFNLVTYYLCYSWKRHGTQFLEHRNSFETIYDWSKIINIGFSISLSYQTCNWKEAICLQSKTKLSSLNSTVGGKWLRVQRVLMTQHREALSSWGWIIFNHYP